MRPKRIVKLFKAVELICRAQGATNKELREHLGIDRKSVYRLLEILQDLGLPIYDDKIDGEREVRWRFDGGFLKRMSDVCIPEISLTFSEILALFLLKTAARTYAGTEIEERLESAFEKMERIVPAEFYNQMGKVQSLFLPTTNLSKDYSGKEHVLDTLTRAMLRQRTCTVRYHSFHDDTVKQFRIDPLHFFESRGGLYVFVRGTRFDRILTLAVERIQEIEAGEERFTYPEDFDPVALLDTAFDMVFDDPVHARVRISPDQARYALERRMHGLRSVEREPDGAVVMDIETSGRWDLKRWVLSFGAQAQVLHPEDLRREVQDELRQALAGYDTP